MSVKVDGNQSFGAGPHVVNDGGLDKNFIEGAFPGLVGTKILTLHGDRREIVISGNLVGTGSSSSAALSSLASLVSGLNALVQDANHTLVDAISRTWTGCMMASWKQAGPLKGPVQSGSAAAWTIEMPYTSTWIQNDFTVTS